jgi:hypothetical protein
MLNVSCNSLQAKALSRSFEQLLDLGSKGFAHFQVALLLRLTRSLKTLSRLEQQLVSDRLFHVRPSGLDSELFTWAKPY